MNSNTLLLSTGASTALLPGLNGGVLLNAAQPLGQNLGQPGFANTLALQQDVALPQQQPAALPTTVEPATPPAADSAVLAAAGEPTAEAGQETETDQSAAEPVLEAQSSHVLAALGLWQPPVAAQAAAMPAAGMPSLPVAPTAAAVPDKPSAAAAESKLLTALPTAAIGAKSVSTADSAPSASFEAALTLSAPSGIDGVRPVAVVAAAVLPTGEAGPAPALVLKGEPTQWQQPLLQALGDRLQLQIAARSEQAVIKLDPPMLGQVEIAIRQQAGELQVRMSASHGEVARQLHQVSDSLRQDLVQRHSGEVTVQVTQTARGGDDARQAGRDAQQQPSQQQAQDQRDQQRRPGRALHEDEAAARAFASSLTAADTPA
ncbi:flagellar hook-length control protein FliK [Paucibacter sp. XJ19-41]|uniref:flagellar hook-length control protein FliK n=1 Tax=Paucibacter sp. XJ19-41 TaxID=2927824 RepID=UPI002349AC05|nr:flagellar hook-length control protein FliK [Paucibacter sp. XJ19-41]MDC6169525.1 flagellar hook-length control protein FliK [Paucibacter sp. XJ19-41]